MVRDYRLVIGVGLEIRLRLGLGFMKWDSFDVFSFDSELGQADTISFICLFL